MKREPQQLEKSAATMERTRRDNKNTRRDNGKTRPDIISRIIILLIIA